MFVPLWLIVLTVVFIVFLVFRGFGRGGADDMIARQRRAAPPAPLDAEEEARVMALPQVREQVDAGRKIAAIKQVRLATGLGLKEAKQLVERHWR